MSSQKYIEVIIDDEDASVVVAAVGYTDGSCRDATAAYEDALGAVEERRAVDACIVNEEQKITTGT